MHTLLSLILALVALVFVDAASPFSRRPRKSSSSMSSYSSNQSGFSWFDDVPPTQQRSGGADRHHPIYILYLEPSEHSHLYRSISSFLLNSWSEQWQNEAHLYHPHCSMTGFFHLPAGDQDATMERRMIDELSVLMGEYVQQQHELHAITVQPVRLQTKNQYGHAVRVPLQVPGQLVELMASFTQRINTLLDSHPTHQHVRPPAVRPDRHRIRVKPIDHMSLAYWRRPRGHDSAVAGMTPIDAPDETRMREWLAEAQRRVDLSAELLQDTQWSVHLYELVAESRSAAAVADITQRRRHEFRRVHTWPLHHVHTRWHHEQQ